MNAIIIDDEPKARRLLEALIDRNCPSIKEVVCAGDLQSGIKLIREHKPKIVFLDIEMPGYSGLQILDFFDPAEVQFEIIFTTAYSDYAIKAFELNAVSYLLKPLRADKLIESVGKATGRIERNQISQSLVELKAVFETSRFKKIALPVSDGIVFVPFDDIYLCQADGMYTKIYTQTQGELLISKPLKHIIELLKGTPQFYRTHRSFLININHIKRLIKSDGSSVLMENGVYAAISKDKREELLSILL